MTPDRMQRGLTRRRGCLGQLSASGGGAMRSSEWGKMTGRMMTIVYGRKEAKGRGRHEGSERRQGSNGRSCQPRENRHDERENEVAGKSPWWLPIPAPASGSVVRGAAHLTFVWTVALTRFSENSCVSPTWPISDAIRS